MHPSLLIFLNRKIGAHLKSRHQPKTSQTNLSHWSCMGSCFTRTDPPTNQLREEGGREGEKVEGVYRRLVAVCGWAGHMFTTELKYWSFYLAVLTVSDNLTAVSQLSLGTVLVWPINIHIIWGEIWEIVG